MSESSNSGGSHRCAPDCTCAKHSRTGHTAPTRPDCPCCGKPMCSNGIVDGEQTWQCPEQVARYNAAPSSKEAKRRYAARRRAADRGEDPPEWATQPVPRGWTPEVEAGAPPAQPNAIPHPTLGDDMPVAPASVEETEGHRDTERLGKIKTRSTKAQKECRAEWEAAGRPCWCPCAKCVRVIPALSSEMQASHERSARNGRPRGGLVIMTCVGLNTIQESTPNGTRAEALAEVEAWVQAWEEARG